MTYFYAAILIAISGAVAGSIGFYAGTNSTPWLECHNEAARLRAKYQGWGTHTQHGFLIAIPPRPGSDFRDRELKSLRQVIKEIENEAEIEKAIADVRARQQAQGE